jgi:hypothetical protein
MKKKIHICQYNVVTAEKTANKCCKNGGIAGIDFTDFIWVIC